MIHFIVPTLDADCLCTSSQQNVSVGLQEDRYPEVRQHVPGGCRGAPLAALSVSPSVLDRRRHLSH